MTKTKKQAPKQTAQEKDLERAKDQAKAQLSSITDMVQRLTHSSECKGGDECELDAATICGGLNLFYRSTDPGMTAEQLEEYREQYHNEEEARQRIEEDGLSVEVRSGWYSPGSEEHTPEEFRILLCTGGPACQIIGQLSEYGEPEHCRLQYQDWFTPWTDYNLSSHEEETLLTYARQFYFGE